MTNPRPSCRRLLRHFVAFAASRARLRLGSRIETSTAMMPMTTSNSTSVKPPDRRFPGNTRGAQERRSIDQLPDGKWKRTARGIKTRTAERGYGYRLVTSMLRTINVAVQRLYRPTFFRLIQACSPLGRSHYSIVGKVHAVRRDHALFFCARRI